jgi:putative DNA primase/helicase
MNFTEKCRGKWPEILAGFGVPFDSAAMRKKAHCPCPSGRAEKRGNGQEPFRFSDREGSGNYFCQCNPDGRGGGLKLVECMSGLGWRDAMREIEDRGHVDASISAEKPAMPIPLLLAPQKVESSQYLASRGLKTPPTLHWGFREDGGKKWPVMCADITRVDGWIVGRHFTFLDGGKKRVEAPNMPARKIIKRDPEGSISGAAVQLMPFDKVLGVAEGIETALAAHQMADVPVWAALNTAGMKSFEIPAGVERLIIFGDRDNSFAGQAAAYALAQRAVAAGIKVTVELPDLVGDWNDVLMSMQKGAA